MNNTLQVICSIYSISCCLPSWFHLRHRGFSGVFTAVCLKDSKCESEVFFRQIQIKNCSCNTNLLGIKCCFYRFFVDIVRYFLQSINGFMNRYMEN